VHRVDLRGFRVWWNQDEWYRRPNEVGVHEIKYSSGARVYETLCELASLVGGLSEPYLVPAYCDHKTHFAKNSHKKKKKTSGVGDNTENMDNQLFQTILYVTRRVLYVGIPPAVASMS
jgi:hypothetical protein